MKTPPTIDPKTIYTDKGGKVSFSVEHTISKNNTPYLNLSERELSELVRDYEYRISVLKEYLRESDMVERKRISEIFGFTFRGDYEDSKAANKLVLKELGSRVKELINENNKLRS